MRCALGHDACDVPFFHDACDVPWAMTHAMCLRLCGIEDFEDVLLAPRVDTAGQFGRACGTSRSGRVAYTLLTAQHSTVPAA